jgi:PepSY-associated TM region
MTRRGQRIVGLLWRWHRRTGVVLFLFVLLLTTTGLALNHSTALGLDKHFVEWNWLSARYGDSSNDLRSFKIADQWVSRTESGRVFFNVQEVASCRGDLLGVVRQQGLYIVGCAEELLLLTPQGQLVESVNASTGLPTPLKSVGLVENKLVVQGVEGWRYADLDELQFGDELPSGALIMQQARGALPADIRNDIPASERWLTWERVLLDLHSGRLMGSAGVWLMDAVAILLACVAFSGVTMWWFHRRRRGRAG